jgi:hypothetical protein
VHHRSPALRCPPRGSALARTLGVANTPFPVLKKQLNTPAKRGAFLAALASLLATLSILFLAEPYTLTSEELDRYTEVSRQGGGDAWRLERRCADAMLPKSSFGHEFWIAHQADSDTPADPEDSRPTLADTIVGIHVKRAASGDSYYVRDTDLVKVREKLRLNVHRCAGVMCARSIDVEILDRTITECGARVIQSTHTTWRLDDNADEDSLARLALYACASLFVVFLLLSVAYDYTLGRVVAWVKGKPSSQGGSDA